MIMINLNNISIAFGHVALLDNIAVRIDNRERVCLIGRNGEGKSTLLKIMSNDLSPDQGQIERQPGYRIARLSQEPELDINDSVFHAVAKGLGTLGQQVESYHDLVQRLAEKSDDRLLAQLEAVQDRLEAEDGWRLEQRVEMVLSKLSLPTEQKLSELSGGWQRRVALAQV
ncbi:MAG: ABC transporter ATP-binding protein, partial [Candidatus Parabeggiatoa sp. nov. 3]